ncbi:cell division protein ZapD [Polaromonas sp. CG_9.5]|uniref:cell division protein ZapD n=1 Tax=Polaromonas sp. CG_9.5 TaxID=3071705 RepID=UPI002E073B61|nr:cell division protein ZapD [Polaromonas sp. CG_9.5]
MILYEYPFNERMRTYLRLENLFLRLSELVDRESPIDHHHALATIFEIMDVGARADLKTDMLKDIEKQKHVLNGYRGNPAISEKVLDDITAQLDSCFASLNALSGKVGHSLTENDWLMSIRSRIAIPGGTCEFDLPAYHAWQYLSATTRQQDLQRWVSPLVPLAESLRLLLGMVRDSGSPQKFAAPAGQYQQMLPQGRTFQLLRLRLDSALGLIPEISCNRMMVSARFMRQESDGRLHTSTDDTVFELTLCS